MQGSESYEWLLDSCLQECRKGISRLEQIAAGADREAWLQEDLRELQALETAALSSFAAMKTARPSDTCHDMAQERLDRLQAKLLDSLQHLAAEGVRSNCS